MSKGFFRVLFDAAGDVAGFGGPGEPGPRRTKRYDPAKRRRNKLRRQAIKAQRGRGK